VWAVWGFLPALSQWDFMGSVLQVNEPAAGCGNGGWRAPLYCGGLRKMGSGHN